jgi:hypothetical protein
MIKSKPGHMSLDMRQFKVPLIMSGVWAGLLLCGLFFSQWEWNYRWGIAWFDVGWIARAMFVFSLLSIFSGWQRSRHISVRAVITLMISFIVAEILRRKMGILVKNSAFSANGPGAREYANFATAYTATILLWTILFPFELFWGRIQGQTRRLSWFGALIIVSAGIVLITFLRAIQFATGSAGELDSPRIQSLQLWMQSVIFITFNFIVARMLIPATANLVSRSLLNRNRKS